MEYALITGASRGIGKAIAERLARRMPVIINYHSNSEAAQQTLDDIVKAGGKGELLPFDVADPKAIAETMKKWQQEHPDDFISVLVNNAGIRHDNLMIFMEDEEWNSVLQTSLNAFFHLTRFALKNMLLHRRGRILSTVSLSGVKGLPGQTNYSAAKAALIGATKALAQEVAPRGITVNAIAPGFIRTDMTADLDEKAIKRQIPAGRFGEPEEVAALADFLASDDAAYINGQVIQINGALYT
jgi:3-oxoacyl-[acyl-carrier protein] reductase